MMSTEESEDSANQAPATNAFASLEAMLQMDRPSSASNHRERQKDPVSNEPPLPSSSPSSRAVRLPTKRSYRGDATKQHEPLKRTKATASAKENQKEREPSKVSPVRKKKNRKHVVSTKESIVGFRPTHWAREASKPPSGRKMFAQPNRKKRQADLEAGLNRSISSTPPPSNAEHGARTFLPTFLSNACLQEEEIEETAEELGTTTTGFSPTRSDTPAPPYKTPKKSKKGPLGTRMQALRDAAKGEQIRLHSGQYPFSLRSSDRSDPRNRATSTSSVTVLGSPVALNRQLVSALCYLHEWTTTSENTKASPPPPVKTLVWVIFRSGTTIKQTGEQLRLYNAIAVPTHGSDKWVIFHTSICEPYPSQLPALDDVSAAVATAM